MGADAFADWLENLNKNEVTVEDMGIVTAKIDEQKTDATRAKILQLVENL